MKMKKMLALLLVLVMTTSLLTACGGGASDAQNNGEADQGGQSPIASNADVVDAEVENSDVIFPSVSISCGDPGSIVPWVTGKDGAIILMSIYEPLFDYVSMGGDLYPVLADEDKGEFGGYDHEAGSNVYRIYLCEDIYDSAGNHMTASDIEFSIGIFFQEGAAGRWTQYDHVEVVDDYTIDWHFTEELNLVGGFDTYMTALYFTEAAYNNSDDKFAASACGTGPYVLKNFVAGSSADLERRDDYWQKDESKIRQAHKANVQSVHYPFITESSQQIIALQTGDVDLVETVAMDSISPFLDGGEYGDTYDIYAKRDNLNVNLVANSAGKFTNDINFRLACYYAVDADNIVTAQGDGAAVRSYAMGNTNFGDYYEEWDNMQWGDYDYEHVTDIELAKEYLAKTDYNGETIEIICKNDSNNAGAIATIIMAMLQQIGVNCNITQYEAGTFQSIQEDIDAWNFAVDMWAGGSYVVASMNSYMSDKSFYNTHYNANDQEFKLNDMIQEARIIENHTKENMEAIQHEIFGNAYLMALMSKNRNTVYNAGKFSHIELNYKGWVLPGGCTYIN